MSDSKSPSTNPGGRASRRVDLPGGSDGASPSQDHESPSSINMPPAPRAIDLNADLGEGFPNDRELLAIVTSASVCCGAHAGDRDTIRQTLRDARERGVVVGAHPGYADRAGFGRRDLSLTAAEITDLIFTQFEQLSNLGREFDIDIAFLKPHGALYTQAQRDINVAGAVVRAAQILELALLGQPNSVLEAAAQSHGVPYVAEGFPDRRYQDDGSLVPRNQPDAVLTSAAEVEAQVLRLLDQGRVATLCIHGDDPHAVANAGLVREVLKRHGIAVCSFGNESA
jgi:5-oxoprolinase (ATP-hydrolysing) subunit A